MLVRLRVLLAAALLVASAQACSSDPESTPAPAEPTPDAGVDAEVDVDAGLPLGEKIDAPAGKWTWVPFPDSACANGKATGIGINPGTSNRVLLYLEGGGACWNGVTCYTLRTASFITSGFGETQFKGRIGSVEGSVLDREDPTNVFRDASMVYVPYCTGDVHAGDKEGNYDGQITRHVGRKNLEAFLRRIVPTFPSPERVILSGVSAGGFGAAYNYWRVHEAFGGKVRVDLVDDSGPAFSSSKLPYLAAWKEAWDLEGALPPGCPECKTDLANAFPYYLKTYPGSRIAFLSYTEDETIRQFFAMSPAEFSAALTELRTTAFEPSTNGRVFYVTGAQHTMILDLSTASGGTTVGAWLTAMQDDAATWTSVTP